LLRAKLAIFRLGPGFA